MFLNGEVEYRAKQFLKQLDILRLKKEIDEMRELRGEKPLDWEKDFINIEPKIIQY